MIHFSAFIGEDTKARNLGSQPSGVFFCISWTHAKEYQESTLACTHDFAVYHNACVGNPLNQGAH
jgi:hypothetical protein